MFTKHPSSVILQTCMCVLMIFGLCLGRVRSQESSSHRLITPLFDDSLAMVGWIDISQVDAEELEQLLRRSAGGIDGSAFEQMEVMRRALVGLGVKRIYALGDLASVTQGPRIAVPCERDAAAVELMLGAFGSAEYKIERFGDVVVWGSQAAMASQETPSGELQPDLAKAIQNIGTPHGVAMAVPIDLKRSMLAVVQSATGNEIDPEVLAVAARAIAEMKSVSVSALGSGNSVKVQMNEMSAETASDVVKHLKMQIETAAAPAADLFRYTTSDAGLAIEIDALPKALEILGVVTGANRSQRANNLKQVALALHNYFSVNKHFPPQSLVDAKGNRLLSWRVLILPYIEQGALYEQFHLDEPWDSPHNLSIAKAIPAPYAMGANQRVAENGVPHTRLLAPLTIESAFGRPGKPLTFRDITDGTSNTLWFVEATEDQSVPWSKPADVVVDDASMEKIFRQEGGFLGARIDGSVSTFPSDLPAETLRALLTIAGGEVVRQDEF